MTIFITTDTHFNHRLQIERGYRPPDYEQRIIDGYEILTKEDTLIHLGDVCLAKYGEVHSTVYQPLPCKKVLVRGNHDQKKNSWYISKGWDTVCEALAYQLDKKLSVLFSHVPISKHDFNKIGGLAPRHYMFANIHGHLHEHNHHNIELEPFHKWVSLERNNYQLIKLDDVLND